MLPALSHLRSRRQRGAALIVSMLLIVLISISAFLAFSQGNSADAARQRRTDEALAMAKAALIGYAVARPLDTGEQQRRLGELPCPDNDNDGIADLTACSGEASRIGRLPWKTLGLPDLRDGDGERLWYAISHIYKSNPRTDCNLPEDAYCLNSDAQGSITVRDANGDIAHDARPSTPPTYRGAIALIIAPGTIITRQDGVEQRRDDAAAMNLPVNYLDIARGEDNANFVDYDSNGFIAGPVRSDATGTIIANDRIAVVTHDDVMPALERRVAQEVANCLDIYASINQNRYPWAADLTASARDHNYTDAINLLAGRVPQALTNTNTSSMNAMSAVWPIHPSCFLGLGLRWWEEWKLRVFYIVGEKHQPGSTPPLANSCEPKCIYAYTPTAAFDVQYFIAVAGKRLQGINGDQPRPTDALDPALANPANFLEQENALMFIPSGTSIFVRTGKRAATFNDVGVFKLSN